VTEAAAIGWGNTNIIPTSEYLKLTARLTVEESFRGDSGTQVTFEMNDCPYPFKEGQRYLVYAHRDREGKLRQQIGYSRTAPLSEAGEDMAYIRSLSQAGGGGRVFGTVVRNVNYHRLHTGDTAAEAKGDSGPASGVKVFAQGEAQGYEARTDGDGRFEFTGLPAGTYKVRADAPAGHTGGEFVKVSLPDRGCAPMNIFFTPQGEIGGQVLSAGGRPVKDAQVTLFSAEGVTEEGLANLERRPPIMTYTHGAGRYGFSQLPAGRYYVAVSLPTGVGPNKTYQRTFYPNARTLNEATGITLAEGQKMTGADVQLPPQ
jgi:hypothetical protein